MVHRPGCWWRYADPRESQKLLHGVWHMLTAVAMKAVHPGIVAAGRQLLEDLSFDGIEPVLPMNQPSFVVAPSGVTYAPIRLKPGLQARGSWPVSRSERNKGLPTNLFMHVRAEGLVFAGDARFRQGTPMGWTGSCEEW
jgi:hypothetical protein